MKLVALPRFFIGLCGNPAVLLSPSVIDWRGFGHRVSATISVDSHAGTLIPIGHSRIVAPFAGRLLPWLSSLVPLGETSALPTMKLILATIAAFLIFAAGCLFGDSFHPFNRPYVLTGDLKLEDATYFFKNDHPPTKAPVVGILRKGNEITVFRKGAAAYLTISTVIPVDSLLAVAHEK